jgi:hypothetical protein
VTVPSFLAIAAHAVVARPVNLTANSNFREMTDAQKNLNPRRVVADQYLKVLYMISEPGAPLSREIDPSPPACPELCRRAPHARTRGIRFPISSRNKYREIASRTGGQRSVSQLDHRGLRRGDGRDIGDVGNADVGTRVKTPAQHAQRPNETPQRKSLCAVLLHAPVSRSRIRPVGGFAFSSRLELDSTLSPYPKQSYLDRLAYKETLHGAP